MGATIQGDVRAWPVLTKNNMKNPRNWHGRESRGNEPNMVREPMEIRQVSINVALEFIKTLVPQLQSWVKRWPVSLSLMATYRIFVP